MKTNVTERPQCIVKTYTIQKVENSDKSDDHSVNVLKKENSSK